MTPFERIIARLIKELLDAPKCLAEFEQRFEEARRENNKDKMRMIDIENLCYRRRIEFVESLLKELTK